MHYWLPIHCVVLKKGEKNVPMKKLSLVSRCCCLVVCKLKENMSNIWHILIKKNTLPHVQDKSSKISSRKRNDVTLILKNGNTPKIHKKSILIDIMVAEFESELKECKNISWSFIWIQVKSAPTFICVFRTSQLTKMECFAKMRNGFLRNR